MRCDGSDHAWKSAWDEHFAEAALKITWRFSGKQSERSKDAAKKAQQGRRDLLLENGNEGDFVAMVKAADPNIAPEKLLALIEHYSEIRRQRAGGA